MTKFTPIGILAIFWFIGIIARKPGIWFPLGVVAMIVTAVVQKKRDTTKP